MSGRSSRTHAHDLVDRRLVVDGDDHGRRRPSAAALEERRVGGVAVVDLAAAPAVLGDGRRVAVGGDEGKPCARACRRRPGRRGHGRRRWRGLASSAGGSTAARASSGLRVLEPRRDAPRQRCASSGISAMVSDGDGQREAAGAGGDEAQRRGQADARRRRTRRRGRAAGRSRSPPARTRGTAAPGRDDQRP